MVETREFDIQNYLKTPQERAAYIEVLLEDGDPSFIASGLGEIARAIGARALTDAQARSLIVRRERVGATCRRGP